MRLWTRAIRSPWCAGFLLAILALSVLHAALPHSPTQRDCYACKALQTPIVAQPGEAHVLPLPPRSPAPAAPAGSIVPRLARFLSPLRAPPPLS
jgi:hypothetical protein